MRLRDPYLQAKYFKSLPLRNSNDTIAHQNEHKKTEHPYHCRKNQQNIQANHTTVCASAREIMFGLCEIVVKIRTHSLSSEFSLNWELPTCSGIQTGVVIVPSRSTPQIIITLTFSAQEELTKINMAKLSEELSNVQHQIGPIADMSHLKEHVIMCLLNIYYPDSYKKSPLHPARWVPELQCQLYKLLNSGSNSFWHFWVFSPFAWWI